MDNTLHGKATIVGVGEIGPGKFPEKSARRLHVEAAKLALDDAGLSVKDVDGVVSSELRVDSYDSRASILAEYLGIEPSFTVTQGWGGATTLSMVLYAASAIAAGLAECVLVVCADNPLSNLGRTGTMKSYMEGGASHLQYEWPYGPSVPSIYGMTVRRHMHEYGTTPEQLAQVAVTFRNHAMLHPKAIKREPITIADVLNARPVATPFRLLDCSQISDGGWAAIVTSPQRARDLKQRPVHIMGAGEAHSHMHITFAPNLTSFGCVQSGRRAFQMAGVNHDDVDVLYLYDAFTGTAIIQLEDLGFCQKGEGGPMFESGRLSLGGALPTNTHGGLLSYGHAGRPGPWTHLVELVLQLRQQADARQVKDAEIGLIHGQGGVNSCHCTLILSNQ